MEIEQYLYDLNDSGEAIVAYTMTSATGSSVQLCNLGASVLSLNLCSGAGVTRDVASGRCVKGMIEDRERFDERLWESRVEVNRVVMSLSYECDGGGIMAEVIFDFDDEDNFEITYQACLDGELDFDLTHRLAIELGDDMTVDINAQDVVDNIYNIDGAKPSILREVATLSSESSQDRLTILSSQPALYLDGNDFMPLSSPVKRISTGVRFIEKSVYRHTCTL